MSQGPMIRLATADDEYVILKLICDEPGEESITLMGDLKLAQLYRRQLIRSEQYHNPHRLSYVIECEDPACHDPIAVIQFSSDPDDHHDRKTHLKILVHLLGVAGLLRVAPKLAARRKVDVRRPANSLHILNINVDPDFQSHGLGAALLAYAEGFAMGLGCGRVSLDKLTSEEELTAWYESHGFKVAEMVCDPSYEKHFGIKGRLLMEKVL